MVQDNQLYSYITRLIKFIHWKQRVTLQLSCRLIVSLQLFCILVCIIWQVILLMLASTFVMEIKMHHFMDCKVGHQGMHCKRLMVAQLMLAIQLAIIINHLLAQQKTQQVTSLRNISHVHMQLLALGFTSGTQQSINKSEQKSQSILGMIKTLDIVS